MIENPMVIGNHQDSAKKDYEDYCCGCDEEIYYGESYWIFRGNPIHAESSCIIEYIEREAKYKVAGE